MNSKLSKTKKKILKAVKEDTLKSVEQLLDSNDIEIDETYFDYALLKAALKRKHKALVNFLLKKNFRVRNPNEIGCDTTLHYAVELRDGSIIKKLLKKGASINDKNQNGKTPFDLAMEEKIYYIINTMLSLYEFENLHSKCDQNLTYFYVACERGFLENVKKFVEFGLSVNSHATSTKFNWNGNTPLHFAVSNCSAFSYYHSSYYKLIIYLLEKGADYTLTNIEGQTPIHLAYYLHSSHANKIIETIFHHSLENRFVNSIDKTGLTHFHICCAENIDIIKKFINNGEDINCSVSLDSDENAGYTALHFAVKNCHARMVNILLNHGANVSLKCKNGSTPLHLACQLGNAEISRSLIHFGAGLTVQDNKGCIPLHCAFYEVPMDSLVSLLLEQTPKDVNYTDSEGLSLFHIACTRNNTQIIVNFLEHGVSPNLYTASDNAKYPGYSAMHFAVEYNRKTIVELLLKYGADPNASEKTRKITPLHISCIHSHIKFYEFFNHKDFDWRYNYENHIDIIKLLLNYKADINAKDSLGKTPIVCLCQLSESPFMNSSVKWPKCIKKKSIFELLDSDLEEEEENEIFKEVEKRIIDIAHILLSYNADIHACTSSGESILHVISKDYSLTVAEELAELFLKNKANVQMEDQEKMTPLHIAVKNENKKLVDIFLNYNANINAKTVKLMTPLHLAADACYDASYYNQKIQEKESANEIVELLLQNGCNIDSQNLKGETALHLAISHLNYPVIKQLLRYGADMNLEDACGHPPALKLKNEIRKNYNPHFNIERILILFKDYIEKFEMIGLHINDKIKEYLSQFHKKCHVYINEDEDISFLCQFELERMKNTKVDQYINLYSILFKDDVEMSRLVKNKSLRNILTDDQLEKNFPRYGEILKLQFKRGTEKIAILDKAKECLNYVTGFFLPEPCSERIFRYLSNIDLNTLMKVKPEGSHKRKFNFDPEQTDKCMAKQMRFEE